MHKPTIISYRDFDVEAEVFGGVMNLLIEDDEHTIRLMMPISYALDLQFVLEQAINKFEGSN